MCPLCGANIFFHTNGNGDVVFFDELGWPWPKHSCLSSDEGVRQVAHSPSPLKTVAELASRPSFIPFPRGVAVVEFDPVHVGKTVQGVVMRLKERTVWAAAPGSVIRKRVEVLSVALYLGSAGGLRIFLPKRSGIRAGDVIEVVPKQEELDGRLALFAERHTIVEPPCEAENATPS